ncbi:DNA-directed DNA polymerase [Tanacetum coccineum]|uniref:DNA-directed DNA polymerase n=1 Tax=Tanacetum coccineum TaxID=301880 RepID=A0ABQ5AIQ9_9ASTR
MNKAAWDLIAEIFINNKCTRSIALKAKLRSLKLGDLSIDAYFRNIESIATILTSLGSPISNDDVVTIALEGLPDKYDNVSDIIVHQEPFPDLKTVHSILTTEEMRLKSRDQVTPIDSTSSSPMVLLANFGNNTRRSTVTSVHFLLKGLDTLSKVSEYLNNLEAYLDDRDSLKAKKGKVEKSEEELEMFEALGHKSVLVELGKHKVVVFTKAPPRAYSKPFMRFSTPCGVNGQGAWDAELDMKDSHNYMMKEMLDKLGFVRIDYGDYGRKMWKDVRVEIYGFIFLVDFVVIGYANEGEPSVIFGRDSLVTTKSKVDFGLGEMRIDLTMLEEERDIDALLVELVETMDEVRSTSGELVKLGQAIQNKNHNEKIKEALDRKYKELEESKPIVEVLENYMTYRKKLDEIMMGRSRLDDKEFYEKEKTRIVDHGLPKKMCDPGNFMLPVFVNGTIQMNALANTGASVSVFPFALDKFFGLSNPSPYHSNLTMADNTQAKAMGEVRNVRIQISYQAYLVDFLVLDIPVDKELPLLLGHSFLRTCGAIIDIIEFMHKPTRLHLGASKRVLRYVARMVDFELWYSKSTNAVSWSPKKQDVAALSSSEAEYVAVASAACQAIWLRRMLVDFHNEQYGPTTIFCDNKATIAMTRNPTFYSHKKHIDIRFHFIRDLTSKGIIELKYCPTNKQVANVPRHSLRRNMAIFDKSLEYANFEQGDMRRGTMSIDDGVIQHAQFLKPRAKAYLENFEVDEEEDWLSCFEVGRDEDGSLPVQLKNTDWGNESYGMYKKIEGDGAWHAKFEKATKRSHPNPLIAEYAKRNDKGTVNYSLQQVMNDNLSCFDETLKDLMKMEYLHNDGDVFLDYSWERALAYEGDVYSEWCLKFFSTMYFERGVDRTKLMTEKCVWFRLCGQEHVLTLP